MPVTFRRGTPADLAAAAELHTHCFPWGGITPQEAEQWLGQHAFGTATDLWVCEEDAELVASMQLLPLTQWIAGEGIPVVGVGAVAISPTARRRGLAQRLMLTGLHEARAQGFVASALYPFRASFYRSLGYGYAGAAHQVKVPTTAFPDSLQRSGVRLVRSEGDRAELAAFYQAWARGVNGMIDRADNGAWQQVLEEGRVAALYRSGTGAAEGYMVVRYRGDLPAERRFLEIEEQGWTSPEARAGLFGWIRSLSDQWHQVVYRAHPSEGVEDLLAEVRLPHGSEPGWHYWDPALVVMRGPMFRILDIESAFTRRRVQGEVEMSFSLDVTDPHMSANQGRWHFHIERGRARAERAEWPRDLHAELSIETLSRLYVGDLTAAEAEHRGLLAGSAALAWKLSHALEVETPWTFDRF